MIVFLVHTMLSKNAIFLIYINIACDSVSQSNIQALINSAYDHISIDMFGSNTRQNHIMSNRAHDVLALNENF